MNTMNAIEETSVQETEIVSGLPANFEDRSLAVNQSLAVSLARAEIDQQIATARALPRNIKRATDDILTLATLDKESAEECVYALPRAGKPIRGPSIRLAEIIAASWGNCRVGTRVVHVDRFEKYVEAEGVFHDLQTNMATTARVRRRISDKNGRIFSDDMIVVTGNAACAIAKRNAILGAVPKAVWRRAYQAVESVIAGDIKTLVERRDRAMKAFAAFGVKPEQVFAALGVSSVDEIAIDHMATLAGMHSALKSGESTVEEMFPKQPTPANGDAPKDLKGALDKLAAGVRGQEQVKAPSSTAQPSNDVPHDPVTGEIIDPVRDAPAQQESAASGGADPLDILAVLRRATPAMADMTDEQFIAYGKTIFAEARTRDAIADIWETKITNELGKRRHLSKQMFDLYVEREKELAL